MLDKRLNGDGWKLVPVEPTAEMLTAIYNNLRDYPEPDDSFAIYHAMLDAAPSAPVQAEPATNERVGLAYKNGYEEALNDCIRNGGEAWARSMFANNAAHIKAAPARREEMAAFAAELKADPAKAQKFFQEAGILNERGALTPEYGGPAAPPTRAALESLIAAPSAPVQEEQKA